MKILPHSLFTAALAGGLFTTLLAQTAPADNAAPAPDAAAPARPARSNAPQAIGGIQADSTVSAYKFYFGTGDAPAGYTKISPDMAYDDKRGYGFDRGTKVSVVAKDKSGTDGVITADKQFYFSTALPEGNYKVTVTLGNPTAATNTSVKAELRRLMLENIATKAGEYSTQTFIVNTRTPKYDGGVVNLKAPRETGSEAWDWDKGLTLEFNGDQPSVAALSIEKVDVPTVYILGDSTSCDQMTEPFNSWGQSITRFFKPDIAVSNHGESGETAADCLSRHRFDKIWSEMKPGDYLFVQFGHNDMKAPGTPESYRAALQKVVDGTKKAGGTLVIVTPMNRHTFSGNTVTNSLREYPYTAYKVAADNNVPWIELNAMSKSLYESFGPDGSEVLFAATSATGHDATHHSSFGSYELAKCIILGIQQDKLDLASHIVDGFHFDPAHPDKPEDFKVAPTPRMSRTVDKPPGS
jgi:lysophospholipase L1-like esterase